MTSKDQLTDADLNAYVDGELFAANRLDVEKRRASDPEAARKVAELMRLNDAIKARYAGVLDAPLPPAMQAVLADKASSSGHANWMRLAAAVILLLTGSAAGYILRGFVPPEQNANTALLDRALSAHAVYVSEVRHPVEVGAGEEQHLLKWLTKRLGADVRAPSLSSLGYNLLGGRLLPNAGAPAAQFMYENSQGRRITQYIRQAGRSENTAFKFAYHKGVSAFYWIDSPLAYAIVGELPKEELLAAARITYEQLN